MPTKLVATTQHPPRLCCCLATRRVDATTLEARIPLSKQPCQPPTDPQNNSKPGARFAASHRDTLTETENPFDKRRKGRDMVKQHASPKVPLRPRSGNEDGGAAAGTPRRTVELPFDESWFEDG